MSAKECRWRVRWQAAIALPVPLLLWAAWIVALSAKPNEAQLAFGNSLSSIQVAIGHGNLILCDHFANREMMDYFDAGKMPMPKPTKNLRLRIPGVSFRQMSGPAFSPVWSVDVSFLFLALISALPLTIWAWPLIERTRANSQP
jgi:hypothetical protein